MNIHSPIPHYLYAKKNIITIVVFAAVFALLFINIYYPFGVDRWNNPTQIELLAFSSLITLVGVLIVALSRVLMYYVCKKNPLELWHYLVWIFCEILCMALFYSLFLKLALNDVRPFMDIARLNVKNASLILLLPYSITWLYYAWLDKKKQVERLEEAKTQNVAGPDMVVFYDEKKELRLSVKKENLLYIESAENYVNICYINKEKLSKYLLRNTLKKMEDLFAGTDIIRTHRSYMVNFQRVKVIRKDKDGLRLELDVPIVIDIPVSKTYIDKVMKTFSKLYQTN